MCRRWQRQKRGIELISAEGPLGNVGSCGRRERCRSYIRCDAYFRASQDGHCTKNLDTMILARAQSVLLPGIHRIYKEDNALRSASVRTCERGGCR